MPPVEYNGRHQAAILWPFSTRNEHGEPVVDDPVLLTVRWELGREQVVDAAGNVVAYDGTLVVDRDIAHGSILYLGESDELTGTGFIDDELERELYEVAEFEKVPDLKGRHYMRIVKVRRFRGSLPTVV